MRIDDANYLSTLDEQSNRTLVLPAIEHGELSVVQVEQEDTLDAVLTVLAQHERPVIIVLPERGLVFSQAEDFARLRQINAPSIVSFIIPRERMSSVAKFAYEAGFSFASSVAKAETAFLRRQATSENSTAQDTGEYEPIEVSWSSGYNPITPLPETPIPTMPQMSKTKRGRHIIPLMLAVSILIVISAALLPILFVQPATSSLTVPHQGVATGTSMGQLSFTNSGQLDPNSNTGLNDIVSLNLDSLAQPPTGMGLYAWLLSDKTQDSIAPVLLGKLQIVGGKAQISYQDPQHTDLLGNYSRFLITAQDANTIPSSPPLDTKMWKYQGSISDIPTPGDEQGYSLLSHMRHLLAKDPTLTSIGLSGGLDIWLYRNTGKIFEWSNAARDDWANSTTDLLRRQIDRVVQYMDGQVYAWRDLPTNTPWLVDEKAGRPGLIDFTTVEQGPASYLSHVRLHLTGMVNAPGHTNAQQQLASKIDSALTQIETVMKQVRKDAVQLAKMSDTQLKSQDALTLLNDMQMNASNAYIGQTGGMTGLVPGIVWIHDTLQQLAQMDITSATPNNQ